MTNLARTIAAYGFLAGIATGGSELDMAESEMRLVLPASTCSYLPDETQSLEYRVPLSISDAEYAHLLSHGWRRHGSSFFRPACPNCVKCRSLRVDVAAFQPTKSQRRIRKKNSEIRWEIRPATVSSEHIRIYNAYHTDMQQRRGWRENLTDEDDYYASFLRGDWSFAYEFAFFDNDTLVGISLVDIVADVSSSVYFYHDPAWRDQGPGTYSLLCELRAAADAGTRYHYLGYWIRECQSMAYKSRFGPHEILREYVGDNQPSEWQAVRSGDK